MSFKQITFSTLFVVLLAGCSAGENASTHDEKSIQSKEHSSEKIEQAKKQETSKADSNIKKDEKVETSTKQVVSMTPDVQEQKKVDKKTQDVDDKIGFTKEVDGKLIAANDVPEQEKKELLAAFKEYIDSFNAKDIERYEHVLSEDPEGFDLNEDIKNTKDAFENYDISRKADNVKIVQYTDNRAFVYADVVIEVKQNGGEVTDHGKQLTQFVKEDGEWKVTSIQAIGSIGNKK